MILYPLILRPPLSLGASHVNVAVESPAFAVTDVGSEGGPKISIGVVAIDFLLLPILFTASTVNEYDVPLVSPAIEVVVALPETLIVKLSGLLIIS